MPTHKPYTFAIRFSQNIIPKLQKSMSYQRPISTKQETSENQTE